jgi:choloylglycine hydrolase
MRMKKLSTVVALLATGALMAAGDRGAQACSRVLWADNGQAVAVARTMDLFIDDKPRLAYLPRGIARRGVVEESTARWTSKHASIVLTAFDAATSDGMNESGLAAHLLYLHDSVYEPADQRPPISNAIWTQYVLDNFATVAEALEGLKQVRVASVKVQGQEWGLHLAIEDATGDSAIIEFVKGKMVVHHGKDLTVMTNEPPMDEQLANLKRYKLFGGTLPMPGDIDPMSRFVRLASYLKTLPAPADNREAIGFLAGLIRNVAVPFGAHDTSGGGSADAWPTRWGTVADLSHKRYIYLPVHSANAFWVDMTKLDPTSTTILAVEPNNPELSGEISSQMKSYGPIQTEFPSPH